MCDVGTKNKAYAINSNQNANVAKLTTSGIIGDVKRWAF